MAGVVGVNSITTRRRLLNAKALRKSHVHWLGLALVISPRVRKLRTAGHIAHRLGCKRSALRSRTGRCVSKMPSSHLRTSILVYACRIQLSVCTTRWKSSM